MKQVVVIDYGMCNLDSVARALEVCGADAVVSGESSAVEKPDAIVLPGVGGFRDAMNELTAHGLAKALRRRVLAERVPFLGICLGMQLMADRGYEGGKTAGLGLVPGEVIRLEPELDETRIPHIGWNEVVQVRPSVLFEGIQDKRDFYFVHSYHMSCSPEFVIGRTPCFGEFISAVQKDFCFGVQFHPEKSQKGGLRLLRNFCLC